MQYNPDSAIRCRAIFDACAVKRQRKKRGGHGPVVTSFALAPNVVVPRPISAKIVEDHRVAGFLMRKNIFCHSSPIQAGSRETRVKLVRADKTECDQDHENCGPHQPPAWYESRDCRNSLASEQNGRGYTHEEVTRIKDRLQERDCCHRHQRKYQRPGQYGYGRTRDWFYGPAGSGAEKSPDGKNPGHEVKSQQKHASHGTLQSQSVRSHNAPYHIQDAPKTW